MEHRRTVNKWGAACAQCSAAKARCIPANNSNNAHCARCQRLLKECTPQVRRPRKKRTVKPSRTAQLSLEERFNSVVDILQATKVGTEATQTVLGETLPPYQQVTSSASSQGPSFSAGSTTGRDNPVPSQNEQAVIEDGAILQPAHCVCRASTGEVPPPPQDDDVSLSIYQTKLSLLFPFVIIPPDTSPSSLQADKPLLWQAIKMVTSVTNTRSLQSQMGHVINSIASHALVHSERSLNMLQAILVALGWFQRHCLLHAQMNKLMRLAMGLMADLGLNCKRQADEWLCLPAVTVSNPCPRTNEERVALRLGKMDAMRCSAYMQRCLHDLQQAPEYETDAVLACMVQLEGLADRLENISIKPRYEESIPKPRFGVDVIPLKWVALRDEFIQIRRPLPRELNDNQLLTTYVHTVSLNINEPPVLDAALLVKVVDLSNPESTKASPCLDQFYRPRSALKIWFDHWFSISVSSYPYLPLSLCNQLLYAISMLSRWARFFAPILPKPDVPPTRSSWSPPISSPSTNGTEANINTSPSSPDTIKNGADIHHRIIQATVASLRKTLLSQYGLDLDILNILGRLHALCQQASQGRETSFWHMVSNNIVNVMKTLETPTDVFAEGPIILGTDSTDVGEHNTAVSDITLLQTGTAVNNGTAPTPVHDEVASRETGGLDNSPERTAQSGMWFNKFISGLFL